MSPEIISMAIHLLCLFVLLVVPDESMLSSEGLVVRQALLTRQSLGLDRSRVGNFGAEVVPLL